MSQLFQSLQPYFTIILIAALIAAVYFSGRYKPIGRFYATVLYLPGLFLHSLATFLKPFDVEQKPNTSPDPGLRTIVLVIASIFAIVATLADGFLTLQALVVLTDDNSVTIVLPASLSWLTVSQGWLLLSLTAITGII